uniref:N-terminal Ras-GEF domain-containing protein n=1 Tax=Sphaeramia orbicularis TaxID=375764 RepID=A0A672Z2G9_9TELE
MELKLSSDPLFIGSSVIIFLVRPTGDQIGLNSSTQEIGEEAEEDAIFTITLRKVQLHQSASKGQRWLGVDTDSALSLYETCKVRTIKAGTLERLVEYMVSAFRGKDSTYVTIFLCTYRSFATTRQVLDLLVLYFGYSTYQELWGLCKVTPPSHFFRDSLVLRDSFYWVISVKCTEVFQFSGKFKVPVVE